MPSVLPLILSLLFWGSAFPGIRAALQGFSPVTMAVFRFSVASACLALLALLKGIRPPRREDLPLILTAAFFSIPGYHVCLNISEKHVTASAASLILSTLPIWVIFWSRIFLKETFPRGAWIGVALSFIGAAIIALGEGSGLHLNAYVGFALASALFGSIYTTIQKKLLSTYRIFDFNCYIIWFGTLMLAPLSGGLIPAVRSAPRSAVLATIYLGVFPAAATFLLWASVVKRMPVSRAVTFLYLVPVIATLLGIVWLNETPSWLSLVGGAVILLGLALTQLLMKRVGADGAD